MPLFQNESSFKNEFDMYENEPVGGTHFHMNGFARRKCFDTESKNPKPKLCLPNNAGSRFSSVAK